MQLGASLAVVWIAAAIGAVAYIAISMTAARRLLGRIVAEHRPRFPANAGGGPGRGMARTIGPLPGLIGPVIVMACPPTTSFSHSC
jgi:hypothetical protein